MTTTATVHAQQKWEYLTLIRKTDTALLVELKASGQEGWELVNVLHYKDVKGETSWIAFLKRPNTGELPKPVAEASLAVPRSVQGEDSHSDARGFDMSDGEFDLKD